MKGGIYAIQNRANGKQYIGSAVYFNSRWSLHRKMLRLTTHHSRVLQRAWNKYGSESFEFKKILVCDRKNLLMYEQICLDHFKPEYNICSVAGSALGVKHTQESRLNMSLAHLGKKRTAESVEKSAAARRGIPRPPDVRERIAAKQRGVKRGPQEAWVIQKASLARTGKRLAPRSEAHRKALSEAHKGIKQSPETIEKRAATHRGRKNTPETIERMRIAHQAIAAKRARDGTQRRGYKHSQETIERMRRTHQELAERRKAQSASQ